MLRLKSRLDRWSVTLAVLLLVAASPLQAESLAFPGAVGWAATTPGGRGGAIIKVTTLASEGPGSLRAALEAKGPRIVVFEVGGIIDVAKQNLAITEPYVTIAGQTAPEPGITILRGGIHVATHDVVIRHLRIRPGDNGEPRFSGWDTDAISTRSAHHLIVDHCSLTWATDENGSASGPRFDGGDTPEDWRQHASYAITYSNNIIAEGLAHATHAKGEHSKGMLIHDNSDRIAIVGNLFAHNYERNPLFKGGVQGIIVNNLIYDPGQRAIHYNLLANEWAEHPYQSGAMAVVGNVMRAGPSTPTPLAFIEIGGDGDLELYEHDNIAVDRIGEPLPMRGRYGVTPAKIIERDSAPLWPEGLEAWPAAQTEERVLKDVGARPWRRALTDWRIVADAVEGRGEIIDSQEQVGGYPTLESTRRPFDAGEWNLDTMEPKGGWPGIIPTR